MKISIESTEKIVELVFDGHAVPARVWSGETDTGIPVHCFVTRIAPTIPILDPRQRQFQEQLRECAAPTADIASFPLRLIL